MASFYTVNGVTVYYTGGEGSPLSSSTGGPVNIDEIRKEYNSSRLYEDPDFPADATSLGFISGDSAAASGKAAKYHEWRRPHELCKDAGLESPQFACNQDQSLCGTKLCSEHDLKQGGLGDCWYLAALQALTTRQEQIGFVIPEDNFTGFEEGSYCGAFHFRFYSMAHCKWVDVIVDDRLPAKDAGHGKWTAAFTKITVPGSKVAEFWPALVEKAYAKFIGSYHFIEGGHTPYGLEDFTGGFGEIVDCAGNKDVSYEEHQKRIASTLAGGNFVGVDTLSPDSAYEKGALEAYTNYKTSGGLCGFKYDEVKKKVVDDKSAKGLGLCPNHAYSVLDAQEVARKDGQGSCFLLKLRNPHAHHEWFGTYGDKDDEGWSALERDLRQVDKTGSTDIDEGVFWMDLRDVLRYCDNLDYCVFGLHDGTKFAWVRNSWPAALQEMSLPTGKGKDLVNYPAYKFQVKHELELANVRLTEDQAEKCLTAIQLILGGYHGKMPLKPTFYFYLFRVEEEDLGKPVEHLYKKQPYFTSDTNSSRDCNKWTFLDPGTYVIVPVLRTKLRSNGKPVIPEEFVGKDIYFAIRLFTENETKLEPVNIGEPLAAE